MHEAVDRLVTDLTAAPLHDKPTGWPAWKEIDGELQRLEILRAKASQIFQGADEFTTTP